MGPDPFQSGSLPSPPLAAEDIKDAIHEEQDGSSNPSSSVDDISQSTDDTSIEALESPPASGPLPSSDSPIEDNLESLIQLLEHLSLDAELPSTDSVHLADVVQDTVQAFTSPAPPAAPTSHDLEDVVLMLQRSTLQDADLLHNTENDLMDVEEPLLLEEAPIIASWVEALSI
ncbi:hypothetical protein CBOM_03486 [Ceraceosorus bombacis]|uniref:Uncharacterized protein n=1 Tax=Ceraceosorus bombacis TaxID=401625 RepID=A0A0P1BM73_9BASI|nr:hypothetical protein CBOM_03486 [Ceraceosorus bombacis]